jgi:beta-barrel assembly-enhancing protease
MRLAIACGALAVLCSVSCSKISHVAGTDKALEGVNKDVDKVNKDVDTVSKVTNAITDLNKDLTPENEYYVGRSVATNILAKHQYKYVDSDAIRSEKLEGLTLYVNQVGQILAAAALSTQRSGDRPTPIAGFHFTVVDSDALNAFAAPGGYIFVTTAAVKAAKSEDELAAILAHEIAHVVRGHALGTIKKSRYANISKDALKASGAMSDKELGQLTELLEGAIDDMVDAFFVKGYSRDTEFEADQVGVDIVAAAGYDPGAMVRYLNTLKSSQKTGSGGFYATHPSAADRISKIDLQLKKLGASKSVPKVRVERFLAASSELR